MAEKLNPTFFAFQKREHGGVLISTSVAYALGMLLLYAVFAGVAWVVLGGAPFMSWYGEVMAAEARGETYGAPPPNPMGALLMIPLSLVWVFLLFVLLAAYESACVRWMLRGDKSAPLQLHFGHDMWRVYGTYWVWFLYAVGWAVTWVIAMIAAGAAGANAGEAGGWIALAIVVLFLLASVYVTVRLSPASATSIGIGEFAPLKAWSVSRGRFWALFGSYVLLFILYVIVFCVLGALLLGSYYAQIFGGLDWTVAQTDPEAFSRAYERASLEATREMLSSPTSLALYVGSQVVIFAVALVFYVLWFGVETRAVQAALEEGKIEKAAPAN